jgi:hypothetical protein
MIPLRIQPGPGSFYTGVRPEGCVSFSQGPDRPQMAPCPNGLPMKLTPRSARCGVAQ